MFGKLLGRSGIITVAVLVGFAVGGIALYVLIGVFPLADYAIVLGLSVLLGVVFVSIAIAFSSAVRSSRVATWGAIVLVLLFLFLWTVVLSLVDYAAELLSLPASSPSQPANWYLFLNMLNPSQAFHNAANALLGVGGVASVVQNSPFYLENWFMFVILGFWLVVPIGLAYLRFRNADL